MAPHVCLKLSPRFRDACMPTSAPECCPFEHIILKYMLHTDGNSANGNGGGDVYSGDNIVGDLEAVVDVAVQ